MGGGGRSGPAALGAAAARGPRGRPADVGAVRRRARRGDGRRPPVGPARALGHRARHLGEHPAHDRHGVGDGIRRSGCPARCGATSTCWTAWPTHRRTPTPPRSPWNPRWPRSRGPPRVRRRGRCPAGVTAPPAVVRPCRGDGRGAGERRAARRGRRGADRVRVQVGAPSRSPCPTRAGFHPGRVGVHRFGLALSVRDRMAAAVVTRWSSRRRGGAPWSVAVAGMTSDSLSGPTWRSRCCATCAWPGR